ncbi:MAG: DinB family protein [Deinococcus sp.]
MTRPGTDEYPPFYQTYIGLVPEADILAAMDGQAEVTREVLRSLADRPDHHPQPGKWSAQEVLGHMLDTERVFGSRGLFFARGDPAPLPGFDQDGWMAHSDFARYPYPYLIAEFVGVRAGHLSFLRHLPPEAWDRRGVVNGSHFTVRALAYAMLGHERHHLGLLRERYGGGGGQT